MINETREIPPAIQRTFLELRSSESYRTALEWLMNEFAIGQEVGELDDSNKYQKGLTDMLLFQAQLTGLRFTQKLETDIEQRSNETDENDTDGA